MYEAAPMYTVDLSTRECDGWVVVSLRGELDVTDAPGVATALAAVAARDRELIVDLAGLEFIDSSGLAALAQARSHARHAGGDLLLAAPQRQVLHPPRQQGPDVLSYPAARPRPSGKPPA